MAKSKKNTDKSAKNKGGGSILVYAWLLLLTLIGGVGFYAGWQQLEGGSAPGASNLAAVPPELEARVKKLEDRARSVVKKVNPGNPSDLAAGVATGTDGSTATGAGSVAPERIETLEQRLDTLEKNVETAARNSASSGSNASGSAAASGSTAASTGSGTLDSDCNCDDLSNRLAQLEKNTAPCAPAVASHSKAAPKPKAAVKKSKKKRRKRVAHKRPRKKPVRVVSRQPVAPKVSRPEPSATNFQPVAPCDERNRMRTRSMHEISQGFGAAYGSNDRGFTNLSPGVAAYSNSGSAYTSSSSSY